MTGRRVLPPVREDAWQSTVTDLATLCGWRWAHFRPARTKDGWRTPVSGTLGRGFPDLVLARERDGRLLFVELKSDAGRVSAEQRAVHATLRAAGAEVHMWRPRDLDRVREVLR